MSDAIREFGKAITIEAEWFGLPGMRPSRFDHHEDIHDIRERLESEFEQAIFVEVREAVEYAGHDLDSNSEGTRRAASKDPGQVDLTTHPADR